MDFLVGSEAVAAGLVTRHELRTRFVPVYRNVYVAKGRTLTAADRARAAWLWSRRQAIVAGTSAAAWHGSLWIDDRLPAELIQPSQHKTKGIVLHSEQLDDDEVVCLRGLRVTSPARTAYDLGRRAGLTLAVVRLDALMRATSVTADDVRVLAERHWRRSDGTSCASVRASSETARPPSQHEPGTHYEPRAHRYRRRI